MMDVVVVDEQWKTKWKCREIHKRVYSKLSKRVIYCMLTLYTDQGSVVLNSKQRLNWDFGRFF